MNNHSATPHPHQAVPDVKPEDNRIHSLTIFIAKAMASHPDDIRAEVDETDATTTVTISAHADDMGRLIGKNGKTINAIRALVKVPVTKSKKKLILTLQG